MLDIEQIESKFKAIVATDEFQQLQDLYNEAKHVFFFGHGGNMSIAEHAAIDASRLTDKNVYAPGGGVIVTSIQGGIPSALWAAQPKEKGINPKVIQVIQHAKYYHTSEILSLTMTYQLIHDSGFMCPTISKKAQERRFEKLGIESEVETYNQDVPPGLENQLANLAIDFDGVVHTFDKGWHDGTCYGAPIDGALAAIKSLADDWNIIIFSAKVRPDRPFVNGKTGYELVDDWLEFHGVRDYVSEITHEKPRAKFYIDDKAIEFTNNWSEILERLK